MAPITLEQAVRNAIKAERAAEAFYRRLSEKTKDEKAREFLLRMADQENDHASAIEKFGNKLAAGNMSVGADWNVELIETAPEWDCDAGVSFEQAMTIALENEQHAELFYDAMADSTQGDTSDFLRGISRAEHDHYVQIKKLIEAEFQT